MNNECVIVCLFMNLFLIFSPLFSPVPAHSLAPLFGNILMGF